MLSTQRVIARRKSLNIRARRIRDLQAKIMPVPKFCILCGCPHA